MCSKEAAVTFAELGAYINKVAGEMVKNPDAYDKGRPELFKKILIAQMAVRKELEVDG